MFRTVYRLPFTLLGIPVLLDVTFLIVLPLLAWIIGSNVAVYVEMFNLPIEAGPLQEDWMPYWLGLIAAVGLFTSVVIHELGHSVVGQSYGLKINNITLWILGGMAQFEKMPRQPGAEALMAIAGPVTSLALGAFCWMGLQLTPPELPAVQFVLAYLLWMNIVLAVFNLLPAMPLDGGRVLRSLLALRFPYLKATQMAAGVSRLLAIALGLVGLLTGGVFLILIAFFIYIAVQGESEMAIVAETLRGIRVRDLMTAEVKTVSPELTVSELMEKMLSDHHLGYPVVDQGQNLLGIVTLTDIRKGLESGSPRPDVRVRDIMSSQLNTITERETALEAFQRISRGSVGRLVVIDPGGRLIGIISKTDLVRAIQIRTVGFSLEGPPRPA